MIWDVFPFRNELDILECRLEELETAVDRHILVEARQDYHGRPKPLVFAENRERFAPWLDRITHIVVDQLSDHPNPWVREHTQRDAAREILRKWAHSSDVVFICDADEIPSRAALRYAGEEPCGLLMRTCHSAVDWLYPTPMPGSVVTNGRQAMDMPLGDIRDGRPGYPVIYDGGWHLSWLGGPDAQREKLEVTCHLELPERERAILATGEGFHTGQHHDLSMVPADVDDSWPRYIYERRCPESWFRPRMEGS